MQKHKEIENKVEEVLIKDKNKIFNIIIDEYVSIEVDNRVKILKQGIGLEESLCKEMDKLSSIKPKILYSQDGLTKTSYYEEDHIRKKDSVTNNINAISNALSSCINTNTSESYKNLQKLISQIKV